MISIYLIITAVTSTVLAKGSNECMFSELTEGRQYFTERGQPLCFCLPNTDNIQMTLVKDNTDLIFKVKDQTVFLKGENVKLHGQYQTKLPNSGAFNLGKAEKRHAGNYTLELFRSNGTLINKVTVHLQIQDFISSSTVVTVVMIVGVVTLLFVALHVGIKKLRNKSRPTTVNECNSEAEVVYTEVKVKNMKKTRPNSHVPLND